MVVLFTEKVVFDFLNKIHLCIIFTTALHCKFYSSYILFKSVPITHYCDSPEMDWSRIQTDHAEQSKEEGNTKNILLRWKWLVKVTHSIVGRWGARTSRLWAGNDFHGTIGWVVGPSQNIQTSFLRIKMMTIFKGNFFLV